MAESFGEAVRRLRAGVSLRRPPTRQIAAALDQVLGADGALVELATARPNWYGVSDDELAAMELARRVEASDVGMATLNRLEQSADRLAIAYHATPPAVLLPEVRRYLGYVAQLVDKRMTLAQRRQLLTAGAWLSLLGATLHIDLKQRLAARARLDTARSLAEHVDHAEIAAWCLETAAWDAITEGDYRAALDLSKAAQRTAPRGGSARIQATAQEGRAWAKLGERRATRDALRRVERLVSPLPAPDQSEHHYRYDPDKQLAYTATTLAWIGDPAAVDCARAVVARFDGGTRPRRAAAARLDLALALASTGRPDEAAGQAFQALASGRIVPSNAWRVAEIVRAVEGSGLSEAAELREAYESLVAPDSR